MTKRIFLVLKNLLVIYIFLSYMREGDFSCAKNLLVISIFSYYMTCAKNLLVI